MADRTVTTRLKLAVTGWTAGKNTVQKDLRDLNTRFKETAGAAAGFRKKLEDAVKRLPAIEIDANSSQAEAKFAQLRGELEKLSHQQIGVDVDATTALAELDRLKHELASLEDDTSFEVRAGIQQAIADMELVAAKARRLDGTDVTIDIDSTAAKKALGDITKIQLGLLGLGAAVPIIASVAAGTGILQGALLSAGLGAKAFGTVAVATMERVQAAVESADFSKLSPEELQLAQEWATFSDVYLRWQQSLNPSVIPAITGGLGLMEQTLPKISPLVAGTANSFVGLEQRAAAALDGPFYTRFLHNVGVAGPEAMTGLGNSTLNVVTGVAGIINAFLPWQDTVVGGLEDATAKFSAWGQQLDSDPRFKEFMAYVEEHAPQVWAFLKNVAAALVNVGEAVGPLGVGSMAGLNLLAQIVAGMDPDHIRLIALAILAVKTAQAGMEVASFWQDLTGKLGGLGGAADSAKGKFGGLTTALKAGGIAVVLAGIAVATDAVGDKLNGLNPGVDELSDKISDLAAKGTPASQVLVEFGSNTRTLASDIGRAGQIMAPTVGQFEQLHETVSRLNTDNPLMQFNNSITAMVSNLYSVDTGRQRLQDFDQALTAMVQSGNAEEAARYFHELAVQSGLSGAEVDKLRALLPGYTGAVDAAAQATAPTGDALNDLGRSAGDAATNVNTLHGALNQLTGLTTNAITAEIGWQQALDDATAAAKENGAAIDTNTQKGRDNRSALVDLAKSANEYRQALVDQGTPLAEVEAKLGAQRSAFLRVAESMGMSRKQAEDLATKLGLIPGNVKTDVKTPGGQQALDLIREYERKLAALDGKTVTTTVKQFFVQKQENLKAAEGGIFAYAQGGIVPDRRYAPGGIDTGFQLRPQPPQIVSRPTILYGEGSTGTGAAEAFIPLEPKYKDNAVKLLGQVADKLGLAVFNKNAGMQVQQVAVTVGDASIQLGAGIHDALGVMADTMGATGTLTSAILDVGTTGEAMASSWETGADLIGDTMTMLGTVTADSVELVTTSMGDSIGGLSGSVDTLSEAISFGQQVINELLSGGGKKGKSKGGSKGGGTGYQLEHSTGTIGGKKGKSKGGSKGGGTGYQLEHSTGSIGHELEYSTGKIGGDTGGLIAGHYGTAGMVGASSLASGNWSTSSGPLKMAPVADLTKVVTAAVAAAVSGPGGAGAYGGSGGPPVIQVDMSNSVIREEADIHKITSGFGFEFGLRAPTT